VFWEEQKWSVNGDDPCPNEVTRALSSGKNGLLQKGEGTPQEATTDRITPKNLYSNLPKH
jgi:hypothetical protein